VNENDVHDMSELYRKTRKVVYEEATRPLSNNPDIHSKNKKRLKKSVEKLCDDAELRKYRGTDKNTATAIWHHLWTKIRYANILSQIATTEINDIKSVFDDYERFSGEDWNIEVLGHTFKGGLQVHNFFNRGGYFLNKQTIPNVPKLVKIISVARLLIDFLNNKGTNTAVLNFIKNGYSDEDVWAIHGHLMEIGYRGDLTALHFMMDIGFPVIKPDIVISKLFLDWGWLHKIIPELPKDLHFEDLQAKGKKGKPFKGKYGRRFIYTGERMYKPVINLAREIVSKTKQADLEKDIGWVTGNPIREFDIFLVKYGQQPEKEFGIERTLYEATTMGKFGGEEKQLARQSINKKNHERKSVMHGGRRGLPQVNHASSFEELVKIINVRSEYVGSCYMDKLFLENNDKKISSLLKEDWWPYAEKINDHHFPNVSKLKAHIKFREERGWVYEFSGNPIDPIVRLVGFKKQRNRTNHAPATNRT